MIISLTGFMGCGKSSVGRRLSELLCWRFVDLDSVIEERDGRSIPEIFAEDGEAEFRRIEKEALKYIVMTSTMRQSVPLAPSHLSMGPSPYPGVGKCQFHTTASPSRKELHTDTHSCENGDGIVLALGGGAVMQDECEMMVHEETVCVYLRASVETLVERLTGEDSGRPLLKGSALRTRILDLMRLRAATYEKVAHLIVDTDGKTIDEIAEEIIRFQL